MINRDPRWLDFIGTHPRATIFHHPEWSRVLAECYGYEGALAAVFDSDGKIVAGLPVMMMRTLAGGCRMAALPFSDHTAPLLHDDAALPALLDELEKMRIAHGCSRIDIRWPLPLSGNLHRGREMFLHATRLDDDPDALFARLHRTRVRQRIQAAEREGVMVRRAESWEDVMIFYRLHLRTRRRLGTPVQPMRFFRLIWERLLTRDLGYLLLAYHRGAPVAGSLFLHWGETLTYKLNASDPLHWDISPNHLLLWRAMQWGCDNGYRTFDWGKTDPGHHDLREFKSGWDTTEIAAHESVLAPTPPPQVSPRAHRIVAGIIRHSPLWVCRMMGEMLYGKAGRF